MKCDNILNGNQCTRSASHNSNFCSVCDHLFIKGMRKNNFISRNNGYKSKSDIQFTPHTDKLTKTERIFINGLGNKPKPIIKKEKPVMTPEPRKIPEPSLLTISEVASLLRVSTLTLKRWGKLGKINAIRINSRGDRRYLRSEIERITGGTHE